MKTEPQVFPVVSLWKPLSLISGQNFGLGFSFWWRSFCFGFAIKIISHPIGMIPHTKDTRIMVLFVNLVLLALFLAANSFIAKHVLHRYSGIWIPGLAWSALWRILGTSICTLVILGLSRIYIGLPLAAYFGLLLVAIWVGTGWALHRCLEVEGLAKPGFILKPTRDRGDLRRFLKEADTYGIAPH